MQKIQNQKKATKSQDLDTKDLGKIVATGTSNIDTLQIKKYQLFHHFLSRQKQLTPSHINPQLIESAKVLYPCYPNSIFF